MRHAGLDPLLAGSRGLVVAELALHHAFQAVDLDGQVGLVWRRGAGGLVQHRHRTVHAADADEAFGQADLRGGAQRGLGGKQALGQTLAVLQQLIQRERLGLGLLEQGSQEIRAGQRVLQLALGAGRRCHRQPRLGLRLLRGDVGAVTLMRRLHRLIGAEAQRRDQRQQTHRGRTHPGAVAPHKFGGAVAQGVGMRTDRFVGQVAADVIGQQLAAGVTRAGFVGQGAQCNQVQLAHQAALQLVAVQAAQAGLVAGVRVLRLQLAGPQHVARGGRAQPGLDLAVPGQAAGMAAGEQAHQQQAQGPDVAGGAQRLAAHLLRARPRGGQRVGAGARQFAFRLFQRACNAEVQQLHLALGRDQHVARLEVAVDDELRMRSGHRFGHIGQQAQAGLQAGPAVIAPAVDGLAFDQLQRQVGLAVFGDTRVQQARDVRVVQARQQPAFAGEAFDAAAAVQLPVQLPVQKLDGALGVEPSVAAPRAPHAGRAPFAQRRLDGPRPEALAQGGGRLRGGRRPGQEVVGASRFVAFEQALQQQGVVRRARLQVGQPGGAFGGRQVQRLVEQRAQADLGGGVGGGLRGGVRSGVGRRHGRVGDGVEGRLSERG